MATQFCLRHYNIAAFENLAQAGILRPLAQALAARGVSCADDLSEEWRSMLSPAMLEGANEAAVLLADAIRDHKHVTVVADYDCDGATACAIAIRGLQMMGLSVNYIVPDRFKLGYGLSPAIVEMAMNHQRKPDLIVTVDNGIASVDGVQFARDHGIDVIITDHHLQGDILPNATCIVNPNIRSSQFKSKSLAGCGVMYYVLLTLRAELRNRGIFTRQTQPRLDQLCDLVALGTVADVVKLDKNNRILVAQGLSRVRRGLACPGINALLELTGRDPSKATVRDFAFSIAPRINAAGRIAEMRVGIECLLAGSLSEARVLAQQLDAYNCERRDLETAMQTDALEKIAGIDLGNRLSVSLFDETWHQGVVGLVASRVKEKIHRPVIAFALDDQGNLKGSGRSIEGIHLRDALDLVSKKDHNLILRFGGHAMAAGLTIRKEDFNRFRAAFEEAIAEVSTPEVFNHIVYIDGALSPEEINSQLIGSISAHIWGQGFEKPLYANDFQVLSQRILKDSHLKLLLEMGGMRFDAIYFKRNKALPRNVRLAYRPEINEYMGRKTIQLIIEAFEE